ALSFLRSEVESAVNATPIVAPFLGSVKRRFSFPAIIVGGVERSVRRCWGMGARRSACASRRERHRRGRDSYADTKITGRLKQVGAVALHVADSTADRPRAQHIIRRRMQQRRRIARALAQP